MRNEKTQGEILDNLQIKEGVDIKVETKGFTSTKERKSKLMVADAGAVIAENGYDHIGTLVVHIYETKEKKDTIGGYKKETMFKTMCLQSGVRWSMIKAAVQQLDEKIHAAFNKKYRG